MTSATVYSWRETQVRVPVDQARATLTRVRGLPVAEAVARLRRGPGTTCEPLARLIDKATAEADRLGCASSDYLVVVGAQIRPGEEIVRVRRKAHGKADWIASVTSDVLVQLAVGPREDVTASSDPGERLDGPPAPAAVTPIWQRALSDEAAAVLERLYEVLDPDLGINIVDIGFLRGITVTTRNVAILTMTLTSPTCPVSGVMVDQIRSQLLRGDPVVADFRVEWEWTPAWRTSDISDEGVEQLRAIGFSFEGRG